MAFRMDEDIVMGVVWELGGLEFGWLMGQKKFGELFVGPFILSC